MLSNDFALKVILKNRGRTRPKGHVAKFILFLLLMFQASETMADSKKTQEVKLPNGETVTNTVTNVAPTHQKTRVLNKQELSNIDAQSKEALAFVKYYLPKVKSADLKDYDLAFRAWQLSKEKRYSDAQVTQMLGSYLGNKCATDLNMEWVEINDEYGTDFAVRGKKAEVISFPYSIVQKRIEKKQYDFLYGVFYTIEKIQKDDSVKSR